MRELESTASKAEEPSVLGTAWEAVKTSHPVEAGILAGAYNFIAGTVEGAANLLIDPESTIKGIGLTAYAAATTDPTTGIPLTPQAWDLHFAIAGQIEKFSTGDTYTKTSMLTEGGLILASFFYGPGEINGAGAAGEVGDVSNVAKATGNLGNPFKNLTLAQVDEAFQVHVQSGKLELKFVNPKTGAKADQNTVSKYSYNLDPGGMYGKKLELPHIDVNYPNPKPLNVSPKIKLPVAGGF
jgi:hypothetical protein